MKKLSIIVGLALVMLTAACSKDATSDINPSLKTLLGVNIDNSQSRTYIGEAEADGTYPVLWSAGDKVLVNGEVVAVADEFVGKNNLTLEATAAAEYKLAYPAELIDGDVLTISEVQEFVEGSFAVGSGVLVGYSKTEDIMLKNLYGYLKFTVANAADVNRVTVVANGGEALSGTYAINFEAATIAPLAGKDLIRVTDVVATNGVATVVVAVPAGDYSKGFTVKVADKTNGVMTKSLKAAGATVEAGVVYAMPQLTYAATATETLICSAADLQAFIAAANGGDFSAYVSADGQVKLGADINLAGKTIGQINNWPAEAVFNGQGFALKNWTATQGLFRENYGTIKNLVIDESCTLNIALPTAAAANPSGIIADASLGLVSGCVNNADVKFSAGTISKDRCIGAIVGVIGCKTNLTHNAANTNKDARVENCVNNGDVTVEINTYSGGWPHLGAMFGAYYPHIEKSEVGGVYNCVNNGDFTVTITNHTMPTAIGGIVGGMGKMYPYPDYNSLIYSNMENCVNNGDVTYNGAPITDNRFYMGGVVGYCSANLTSVTNNGNVTYAPNAAATKIFSLGGVVGMFTANLRDVHNTGVVKVDNITTSAASNVGGVAAVNSNKNTTAMAIVVDGCTNSGEVNVTYAAGNNSWQFIGGLLGNIHKGSPFNGSQMAGLVAVTNCKNSGAVNVTINNARPLVGGIAGQFEKGNPCENCVNEGALVVSAAGSTEAYVAGISATSNLNFVNCQSLGSITTTGQNWFVGGLGARLNDTAVAWDGCVIDCDFVYPQGTKFGLLLADTWISADKTAIVGANSPIVVKKTTTVNGVAVTEAFVEEHSNLLGRNQGKGGDLTIEGLELQ
ncbi:MAG: hypothetical protein IIV72_04480 [Alistipes sp.]|nr:hypothetical protein [Alistipes sp.]